MFHCKGGMQTPEYIELLGAFNEVYRNYKEIKKEYKIVSQNNQSLQKHSESLIVEVKSLWSVKDDFDKIKKTHSRALVENENLNTKNLTLKKISEVKAKYEEISTNVKEFNKGKEKLHELLTYQSNDRNKFGLDFDENSAKNVSTKSKLEDVFIKK